MSDNALRNLPSIDQMLRRAGLQELIAESGRENVRDRLREVMEELRTDILDSETNPVEIDTAGEVERRLKSRLQKRQRQLTQRVINATGVVLHTNLGRAPLGPHALTALQEVGGNYSNLEYDLETGLRGYRGSGLEAMLIELLGCEAAAVVNNCAAAVLLTLNTLADGGEVIISRGELIEIGGSFRIPDVIEKSGARIREVGTTNRTHLRDYEKAINENTRLIFRAHPSNYRISGFTKRPSLEELVKLAQDHNLPFFEDLGSGCLIDLAGAGVNNEPTVRESLTACVPVIAFSGDKLLGGPQSGIITGNKEIIRRIKSNPLMRALRVDKLTFAALEATIETYLTGKYLESNPSLNALHLTHKEIDIRAGRFIKSAKKKLNDLNMELIDGDSVIGGGCAPEAKLPTKLIAVTSSKMSPTEIESKLRSSNPPVIVRIEENRLMIDLRTVQPREEKEVLAALAKVISDEFS